MSKRPPKRKYRPAAPAKVAAWLKFLTTTLPPQPTNKAKKT